MVLGSQKGMSLIGVMLAAALGVVVMAVITSVTLNSIRWQNTMEAKLDFNELRAEINTALNNTNACTISLGGKQFTVGTEINITPLFYESNGVQGERIVGLNDERQHYKITKLSMLVSSCTGLKCLGKIKIEGTKVGNLYGAGVMARDFRVMITASSAAPLAIANCNGQGDSTSIANMCSAISGTFNAATGQCSLPQATPATTVTTAMYQCPSYPPNYCPECGGISYFGMDALCSSAHTCNGQITTATTCVVNTVDIDGQGNSCSSSTASCTRVQ